MAVDNQRLRTVEPESVAEANRLQPCLQRPMLCAFVHGERRHAFARGDFRQMLGFLCGAPAARQRGSGEHRGRQKRRWHQGAADLLHHDPGLDAAEPAAAEFLVHQQTGKAHLGKRLP